LSINHVFTSFWAAVQIYDFSYVDL